MTDITTVKEYGDHIIMVAENTTSIYTKCLLPYFKGEKDFARVRTLINNALLINGKSAGGWLDGRIANSGAVYDYITKELEEEKQNEWHRIAKVVK